MILDSLFKKTNNNRKIAFTFDDGPSLEYTNKILKELKRNHAKATFFVIGKKIEERSDILKNIVENGCEIGNHTYNHEQERILSKEELYESIKTTSNLIEKYTNTTPKLVRLPEGKVSEKDANLCREMNLSIINWSVDSGDWFLEDEKTIYNSVINDISEGSIILFHDTHEHTYKVIKLLLKILSKSGYEITTVSSLLNYYGIELEPGKIYYGALTNER